MADAHYTVLFDRIREQYRRENWLSPEGRRIDPGLRLAEKLSDREDLQRRYYWTDEQSCASNALPNLEELSRMCTRMAPHGMKRIASCTNNG